MKIGILTFHEVFNPGAFLQAYATQQLLARMKHDVEVIDYNPPAHRYSLARDTIRLNWRLLLHTRGWIDNYARNKAFLASRRSHLRLSKKFRRREDVAEIHYDAVVVGADIVWNFVMKRLGRDPIYFGHGINAGRLIAFAPSCGSCSTEDVVPDYLKSGLSRFHRISVRDGNTQSIVAKAVGIKADLICDPTFQLHQEIKRANHESGNFILVYLLPGLTSRGLIREILALRQRTKLPIVAVLYRQKWADKNYVACGPFDWLEAIRNARYVITNTFHGTIFSIMTGSNFAVELNPAIRSKTEGMLYAAGLESRIFGESSKLPNILCGSDYYESSTEYIKGEALKARMFIANALD